MNRAKKSKIFQRVRWVCHWNTDQRGLWKSQNSISLRNPFCSFLRSQIGYRTPSNIVFISNIFKVLIHTLVELVRRQYNRVVGIKKNTKTLCLPDNLQQTSRKQNQEAGHRKSESSTLKIIYFTYVCIIVVNDIWTQCIQYSANRQQNAEIGHSSH